MARRVSKKLKIRDFYKQISCSVLGIAVCVGSQVIETSSAQEATRQELNRISETTSKVTSDLIMHNHSVLSNAVLILGICIVILAVISAVVKVLKDKK